uniref:Uncharacterized protein n=1 Tax=Romanomermis culicivorax TaxID=13658 RepID=A0A915JSY8_ROMCU
MTQISNVVKIVYIVFATKFLIRKIVKEAFQEKQTIKNSSRPFLRAAKIRDSFDFKCFSHFRLIFGKKGLYEHRFTFVEHTRQLKRQNSSSRFHRSVQVLKNLGDLHWLAEEKKFLLVAFSYDQDS